MCARTNVCTLIYRGPVQSSVHYVYRRAHMHVFYRYRAPDYMSTLKNGSFKTS